MKKNERLGARIKRALEIDEILGDNDVLEMRGTKEITVRECRHIIHYAEDEIKLALKEYVLIILGKDLYFTSYSNGFVRVDGKIFELKFVTRVK